jgi:diadenosine tetraphosphate (Ap4A) HIT family hydrolase
VLATCPFCYGDDDSPPKAPVVAMGTRAYLARAINEELVDGHCLIVPIQHHLTMLEADDDVWDEIRVRVRACAQGALKLMHGSRTS